jgi:pepF/M3 family oligoendopeptidase
MAGSKESESSASLPRWDLDPVFPGFGSPEYKAAKERLAKLATEAESTLAVAPSPGEDTGAWTVAALAIEDEVAVLYSTLGSYCYARYSTATRDEVALGELNAIEALGLSVKRLSVLFRNALAARRDKVLALSKTDAGIKPFAFHIEEELAWQAHQMAPELEDLAADLLRSGGDAWGRLQEAVSSNTSMVWDEKTGERKTLVALRALAFDPDRAVRQKAWKLEIEAWKGVEIPMAAALNGVKGSTISLEARRGWNEALDKSIVQARITPKTLEALTSAMEESLPIWRRYFKIKASLIGVETCAFYDIFAPVGQAGGLDVPGLPGGKKWSWKEASDYIVDRFGGFDPAMGDFARRAFDRSWIDAEPREGKVGGAYCMYLPLAKAPRVLCNFDGSFSSLTTVAHELGHAWHSDCLKDLPIALTEYPMTLAETASIFAETVVFESAISSAAAAEKLGLVEGHIQDGCQVIVDILSRFRFEKAVFERRKKAELSAEEYSTLMLEAQKSTYGDGLDPDQLHQYMWAVKGHYYSPGLAYYNFPYAFGLLFGLGLYDRYRREGPAFAASYRQILRETGSASAVDVTRRAGCDIESQEFWKGGLDVFARQISEFGNLAKK